MTPPRLFRSRFVARAAGIVLLLAWAALWVCSFARDQSCARSWSWLPLWDRLSVDFTGNFLCSRAWVSGADPYKVHFSSPFPVTYGYTPQTLWQFAWCALVPSRHAASLVWFAASTAIIACAVVICLRQRARLGLRPIDPALALALVLFSSPVFFELERANCNGLILLHILLALAALRLRSFAGDLAAGTLLALAAWTKIYPAAAIPALLVLRRPRAFAAAICSGLLIGALDLGGLREFWLHRQATASMHHPAIHGAYDLFMHPAGAWWVLLWRKAGVTFFEGGSQSVYAAAIMAPFVLVATIPVWRMRAPKREMLALPYLLIVISAATFLLPIANDYNLLFLPLALVCVFGPQSGWLAVVLFIAALPWLQPFRVPIDAFTMTALKLCCLGAAAAGLHARARFIDASPESNTALPDEHHREEVSCPKPVH